MQSMQRGSARGQMQKLPAVGKFHGSASTNGIPSATLAHRLAQSLLSRTGATSHAPNAAAQVWFIAAKASATRSAALPDIPTMAEFVPGYEASGWYGIGAPTNTPTDIIDRLNKEITALADPKTKARLADLGAVPMSMTPAEFGKFIAGETDKWGKVIRAANIKPE